MKFNVRGSNFRNMESLVFKNGTKQIIVYADKKEYIPDGDISIAVWKKTYRLVRGKKEYIEIDPDWGLVGYKLKEGTQANIQILD